MTAYSSQSPAPCVIVTRPLGQGETLVKQLQAAGYLTDYLPMLEIQPVKEPQATIARAALARLSAENRESDNEIDLALFISTNAVRFTAMFCQQQRVQWPLTLPCLGIGDATRQAIANCGWAHFAAPQSNFQSSEELLQQPWIDQLRGQTVAIFRGVGGREFLAEQLQARDVATRYIETYCRSRPHYSEQYLQKHFAENFPAAEQNNPSCSGSPILIFASAETLTNFYQYACQLGYEAAFAQSQVVVPSPRVADLARQSGLTSVHIAGSASDDAFLQAIATLRE